MRCLRRRIAQSATEHKSSKTGKTWLQGPLKVSRVMQAFRCMAVKERLLRLAGSERYLQRKHFVLKSTGFTTAAAAAAKQCEEAPLDDAIFSEVSRRVKESREHA